MITHARLSIQIQNVEFHIRFLTGTRYAYCMKQSAGLLVYSNSSGEYRVLLVHPGGPFWAKKDKGAWSLPKGEIGAEDALTAAKREFSEEVGLPAPEGDYIELGSVKMSSKVVQAWAVAAALDIAGIKSNETTMEWPPRSGEHITFPEVDKAEWFNLSKARIKLHPVQAEFIDRLQIHLGIAPQPDVEQTALF